MSERSLERGRPVLQSLLAFGLLAGIWAIAASFYEPKDLPGPLVVSRVLTEVLADPQSYLHLLRTAVRIFAGFIASFALGVSMGLVMGLRRRWEAFFELWVTVGLAIPAPAWAMVVVLLIGLNEAAAVTAISLLAGPFVATEVWQGTKAFDAQLLEMASAFRLRPLDRLRHVMLPQLAPFLLSAARYGFGLCWKVTVLVEMIALGDGVGVALSNAFREFEMEKVLAWTILFTTCMALIESGIWKPIERRVFRWRTAAAPV